MLYKVLALSAIIAASAFSHAETAKKTTRQDLKARNYEYTFEEYINEFKKTYSAEERAERKLTFDAAMEKIRAHNEQVPAPSWFMGLSEHIDKSEEEWKGIKGLHKGAMQKQNAPLLGVPRAASQLRSDIPNDLDWRNYGVVTPVKNQASCGSCWAFSATETVESAVGMAQLNAQTKVDIPILSPQQLVDCAPNPQHCGGSGGCEGSIQPLAFQYLIDAGGMDLDADYRYTARDGTCKASRYSPAVGITGLVNIPTNDYNATMNALATAGPIAISVDASWSFYEGGVFSPPSSGIHTTIDHAVQLVGYGTENGMDYWLVRNSWGTGWGERGYIKLQRFGEGKEPCGIDKRPADGFGCDGGPSQITVCGTSGMLSGSSYVLGAHIL